MNGVRGLTTLLVTLAIGCKATPPPKQSPGEQEAVISMVNCAFDGREFAKTKLHLDPNEVNTNFNTALDTCLVIVEDNHDLTHMFTHVYNIATGAEIARKDIDLKRRPDYEHLMILGEELPSTPHNDNRFDALTGPSEGGS